MEIRYLLWFAQNWEKMPFLTDKEFVFFFNWEIFVKFVDSYPENSWKHVMNSIKGVPEDENAIKMDPVRFSNFVSDNYMFYTKLLSKVLRRFQRLEISSPKNAFMLFRVLKVISQENLFPCIKSAAMAQGHLLQRHDKSKGRPFVTYRTLGVIQQLRGPNFTQFEIQGY